MDVGNSLRDLTINPPPIARFFVAVGLSSLLLLILSIRWLERDSLMWPSDGLEKFLKDKRTTATIKKESYSLRRLKALWRSLMSQPSFLSSWTASSTKNSLSFGSRPLEEDHTPNITIRQLIDFWIVLGGYDFFLLLYRHPGQDNC